MIDWRLPGLFDLRSLLNVGAALCRDLDKGPSRRKAAPTDFIRMLGGIYMKRVPTIAHPVLKHA